MILSWTEAFENLCYNAYLIIIIVVHLMRKNTTNSINRIAFEIKVQVFTENCYDIIQKG